MSQISSINFKKSNPIQTRHNDRDLPPNYLIGGENEVNRNHTEALALRNKIVVNAMQNYTKYTGQKFQAKSFEWSAVVNLKPNSTMADLEKLSEHFKRKYGFQCYQIAIHRDEGHINELGEKVINHHAHLEFITLDKETGKNNYRRELITPNVLRQIQSEVAEILQMERGQDKRISKRERIEPRKYAQMKEQEKKNTKKLKQELLTQKDINARIEMERKTWIQEKNHTAEEYKKLRVLKEQSYKNIQDLELKIQDLNQNIKSQKSKINTLESDLSHEKQKNKELLKKNNESDFRAILSENERLKEQNEELSFFVDKMSEQITSYQHRQSERVFYVEEVKEIIAFKDDMDNLKKQINNDLNAYDNVISSEKPKYVNRIADNAEILIKSLKANQWLENLFSFEKYERIYQRVKEWLKDKVLTSQKSRQRNFSR